MVTTVTHQPGMLELFVPFSSSIFITDLFSCYCRDHHYFASVSLFLSSLLSFLLY